MTTAEAESQASETGLVPIAVTINGARVTANVEPRRLLIHFLREDRGLTGTHVGCDTSQCGACAVLLNGRAVKSCAMLAAQADGAEVTTIEGVASGRDLHPVQVALRKHHGLQCGFCTPGMVISAIEFLNTRQPADDASIRHALAGNICRCTGYQGIIDAIAEVAGSEEDGK
ncbi:MAG TPA: (2Fe-2S)-binding protein [Trebonia sp.]